MDVAGRVWTVPALRMKAKREHRVPLCGRALEILNAARGRSGTESLDAGEHVLTLDGPTMPAAAALSWWQP